MKHTTQTAFALISSVEHQSVSCLRQRLLDVKNRLHPAYLDFTKFKGLHFANIALCEDRPPKSEPGPRYEPLLIFEINVDGEIEAYLDELCGAAPDSLRHIYQCSRDYPPAADGDVTELRKYVQKHVKRPNAVFKGRVGGQVSTILGESALIAKLQSFLRDRSSCSNPAHIKADIDRYVESNGLLDGLTENTEKIFGWRYRKAKSTLLALFLTPWARKIMAVAGLILLGVVAFYFPTPILVAAGVIGLWLILLRLFDHSFTEGDIHSDNKLTRELAENEALSESVHNHLVITAIVKPTFMRLVTLKLVLRLAGPMTAAGHPDVGIHFAHWTIISDPKNRYKILLFLSNYDFGWTHYLDLFIDRAHTLINAIWGNAMHFPKTKLFFFKGAQDAARLKETIRFHQHVATVRYCPYKRLPISTIFNNTQIRNGIGKKLRKSQLAVWLARF